MCIILANENSKMRELLSFLLELSYNYEIVDIDPSLPFAAHVLKEEDKKIELLILDNPAEEWELSKHITEIEIQSKKTLVIGSDDQKRWVKQKTAQLNWAVSAIGRTKILENLCTSIYGYQKSGDLSEVMPDAKYRRIRTRLLRRLNPLHSDVYFRLNSSKFLKIFKEGDGFTDADLEKYYSKKNVGYFYVEEKDAWKYLRKYQSEFDTIYSDLSTETDLVKEMKAGFSGLDVEDAQVKLHIIASSMGIPEEVEQLVHTHVRNTLLDVKKSERLKDLLKKQQLKKDDYITTHSVLLAHISCVIATKLDWTSDVSHMKLIFSSLFHDLIFKNHILAAIHSQAELKAKAVQFSEEERKAYLSHPKMIAEILRNMSEVPLDVDRIIYQHHEEPDGSGFPEGLTHHKIFPMAAAFIVAHHLVDYVMEKGIDKFQMSQYLETIKNKFKDGVFRKIYRILGNLSPELISAG